MWIVPSRWHIFLSRRTSGIRIDRRHASARGQLRCGGVRAPALYRRVGHWRPGCRPQSDTAARSHGRGPDRGLRGNWRGLVSPLAQRHLLPVFDAGDLQGSWSGAHSRRSMGSPSCPCSWAPFGRCGSLRRLESREARPFIHIARRQRARSQSDSRFPEACERSCTERRKKR